MLSVFFLASLLLSSCASRGFKLSQQMPGMDNHLNSVKDSYGKYTTYQVTSDGSIQVDEGSAFSQNKKRSIASNSGRADELSFDKKLYFESASPFVGSTLDPENGAALLKARGKE